jgi:predicted SAM-dependent methyltransferase
MFIYIFNTLKHVSIYSVLNSCRTFSGESRDMQWTVSNFMLLKSTKLSHRNRIIADISKIVNLHLHSSYMTSWPIQGRFTFRQVFKSQLDFAEKMLETESINLILAQVRVDCSCLRTERQTVRCCYRQQLL